MTNEEARQCYFCLKDCLRETERQLKNPPWNTDREKEHRALLNDFEIEVAMTYGDRGLPHVTLREAAKYHSEYTPRGLTPSELYVEAERIVEEYMGKEGEVRGVMDPPIGGLIRICQTIRGLRRGAEEIVPHYMEDDGLQFYREKNRELLEGLMRSERKEPWAEELRLIVGDPQLMASPNSSFHRLLMEVLDLKREECNKGAAELYMAMAEAVRDSTEDTEIKEEMESTINTLHGLLLADKYGDVAVYPYEFREAGAKAELRAILLKLPKIDKGTHTEE